MWVCFSIPSIPRSAAYARSRPLLTYFLLFGLAKFKVCIFSHSRDIRGSQNLESRSRDLGHAPFRPISHFLIYYPLPSISMQNLRFVSSAIPEILGGSQNVKSRSRDLGHAPFWPIFHFFRLVSLTINLRAKLEVCVFSHSRDIRGASQNLKSRSRDLGHAPFWPFSHFFV